MSRSDLLRVDMPKHHHQGDHNSVLLLERFSSSSEPAAAELLQPSLVASEALIEYSYGVYSAAGSALDLNNVLAL